PAVYASVMRALVFAASAAMLTASAASSQAIDPATGLPAVRTTAPAPIARDSLWQKRWWIEKTARILRGGDGIGPNDDINALLQLPEEEIARRFMSDIRFGDAILDFNMYYLGFKVDDLRDNGAYRRNAFDFSNAVAAAQALLTGGDYLKLFDL